MQLGIESDRLEHPPGEIYLHATTGKCHGRKWGWRELVEMHHVWIWICGPLECGQQFGSLQETHLPVAPKEWSHGHARNASAWPAASCFQSDLWWIRGLSGAAAGDVFVLAPMEETVLLLWDHQMACGRLARECHSSAHWRCTWGWIHLRACWSLTSCQRCGPGCYCLWHLRHRRFSFLQVRWQCAAECIGVLRYHF